MQRIGVPARTRADLPWPLPRVRPKGPRIGETPQDVERAIDLDARARAAELQHAIRDRRFKSWPEVRSWMSVALQDASIGCAYGVGVLARPFSREESGHWLRCFLRQLPQASRVYDQTGQAIGALPDGWRDLVWW